jgi:short-subunit dehydrogenase
MEKMEAVAKRIRDEYKVQTKIIQFDFSKMATPDDVKELYAKLDTIKEDVCILANNAGKAHANSIIAHSVDLCFNMVNVNVNTVIFMSRYFLARFKARFENTGKRSAVINVASVAALGPSPNTSVYGATKAFDRIFSLSM